MARSATSPMITAASASSSMRARSGGLWKYVGVTPIFDSRYICASSTPVRDVAPSATRRPASDSSGTVETRFTDSTGPSLPTAMSGRSSRSSALRRYSTSEIGPMSRSPATSAALSRSGESLCRSTSISAPERIRPQ